MATRIRKRIRARTEHQSLQRSRLGKRSAPMKPYLLGRPLPRRRQPVKGASREAGARHAPTLTGWRWSGCLASSGQGLLCAHTPILANVRMTSQLRGLAWRHRRCVARCVCRARAATARDTCVAASLSAFFWINLHSPRSKGQISHSEGTSCCSHCAARSLIRSKFSIAGSPFRTIVTRLRSLVGNLIALATAEHSFIVHDLSG